MQTSTRQIAVDWYIYFNFLKFQRNILFLVINKKAERMGRDRLFICPYVNEPFRYVNC